MAEPYGNSVGDPPLPDLRQRGLAHGERDLLVSVRLHKVVDRAANSRGGGGAERLCEGGQVVGVQVEQQVVGMGQPVEGPQDEVGQHAWCRVHQDRVVESWRHRSPLPGAGVPYNPPFGSQVQVD